MDYEYIKIPKLKASREFYEKGANVPTYIDVYDCFCKKGTIEHSRVPGFDDDYITVNCAQCRKKYKYIERVGSDFKVYL